MQSVGRRLDIAIVPLPDIQDLAAVDNTLAAARQAGVQALVGEGPVPAPVLLGSGFDRVLAWATENRVLTYTTTWVRGKHLLTFGPDPDDLRQIAIAQINRILRGAKPAQIPIEQPTRFSLIVNRKISTAMGLVIPNTVLLQATEVLD